MTRAEQDKWSSWFRAGVEFVQQLIDELRLGGDRWSEGFRRGRITGFHTALYFALNAANLPNELYSDAQQTLMDLAQSYDHRVDLEERKEALLAARAAEEGKEGRV